MSWQGGGVDEGRHGRHWWARDRFDNDTVHLWPAECTVNRNAQCTLAALTVTDRVLFVTIQVWQPSKHLAPAILSVKYAYAPK